MDMDEDDSDKQQTLIGSGLKTIPVQTVRRSSISLSPRTAHEFPSAVRTNGRHLFHTLAAEGAFVTAYKSLAVVMKLPVALFANASHLKSH
jgi:hypothetical protein